jgi:hypothetical protein
VPGAYLFEHFRELFVFRDELLARPLLGFGALLPELLGEVRL